MNGAVVRVQGEDGYSFITLTGEEKNRLNAWQIIRPRSKPKSEALFITLRGKNAGQRMSIKSIRRIARQADAKPFLNIRFAERSENQNAGAEIIQDKLALRVIQGGRG